MADQIQAPQPWWKVALNVLLQLLTMGKSLGWYSEKNKPGDFSGPKNSRN